MVFFGVDEVQEFEFSWSILYGGYDGYRCTRTCNKNKPLRNPRGRSTNGKKIDYMDF